MPTKKESKLLKEIRLLPRYTQWRNDVLKRDIKTYPRTPKGIQVHHRVRLLDLVKQNGVTTVGEALKCEALWDISNGVTLTRGEHYIISCLERHKHFSPQFKRLLLDFAE